jgi:hypothetical protein
MVNNGDYYNLQNQKQNTESEVYGMERSNHELREKIERLQKVKSAIEGERDDFDSIKRIVGTMTNQNYNWKGKTFDDYRTLTDSLNIGNTNYYNSLENILNRLNEEIVRLENEIYSNEGSINSLRSLLDRLVTEIERLLT